MSIYDNAGVALIPSGTKASKLYSVLPANGDGDFTHSRGSTATRVNKDGLIESVATNVPRLDYPLIDGVVQDCPALLLEPSRTNLITYSEDFSQWTLANSGNGSTPILTSNYSNDLGLNVSRVIFERTSASTSNTSTIRGNDYSAGNNTFSIYIKSNTSNVTIDFRLGSSITPQLITTEWQRLTFTGSDFYRSFFGLIGNDSDLYADLSIAAAQAEAGSYATSYIPTSGSTATRSADVCNGSGTSAEFNDSEGVLFAEIAALANDNTYREISISDSTTSNRIEIRYSVTNNQIQAILRVGSSTQCSLSFIASDLFSFNKCLLKYKENDFAFWVNGFEVATDTSGSTYSSGTLTELAFDAGDGGSRLYGNTKQLMTFKTALTDSELETLTSWDSFNAMAKGQLYTIE